MDVNTLRGHDVCEAHAEEDETEGEGDPGRELEVGGGQQEPDNILLMSAHGKNVNYIYHI